MEHSKYRATQPRSTSSTPVLWICLSNHGLFSIHVLYNSISFRRPLPKMKTNIILPLLACVALAALTTTANADCQPGCIDECNAFAGNMGMNPAIIGTYCKDSCDKLCDIISHGGDCQENCISECRSFNDDRAENLQADPCEDHCNRFCG